MMQTNYEAAVLKIITIEITVEDQGASQDLPDAFYAGIQEPEAEALT